MLDECKDKEILIKQKLSMTKVISFILFGVILIHLVHILPLEGISYNVFNRQQAEDNFRSVKENLTLKTIYKILKGVEPY